MCLEPEQSRRGCLNMRAGRAGRTLNHNHRAPESTRCFKFWKGCASARVFSDKACNLMRLHERSFRSIIKRSASRKDSRAGGQRGWVRGLNRAQQVSMLRGHAEGRDLLASGCQKNPQGMKPETRRVRQQAGCGSQICDRMPRVSRHRFPCRALQTQQRQAKGRAGRRSVLAHGGGKGMCGVNHGLNGILRQPVLQAVRAAKTTKPDSHLWQMRVTGHASQREGRRKGEIMLQQTAQARGFRCAAQNQHGQRGRSGGAHATLYPEGRYSSLHSEESGQAANCLPEAGLMFQPGCRANGTGHTDKLARAGGVDV